jgi:hypothetical protein
METEQSLYTKICRACNDLQNERPSLLDRRLNERTVTATIAFFLQMYFGDSYFVDCEYSKMRDGSGIDIPKKLRNWPKERVYPDIIVHKRTPDDRNNLAIIEAKWGQSERRLINEEEKVMAYMTEPTLKYHFGFILVLDTPLSIRPIRP